tara:strand:+ start:386 stop:2041 length:1656 start_codon:yes stop_codon:yes gene_type:complete
MAISIRTNINSNNKSKLLFLGSLFIFIIPILIIFLHIFVPTSELWSHLIENVLFLYITNTLIIVFWVIIFTLVLGVSTAWLMNMCKFPGQKIYKWMLMLPLAIPAYVLAYIYAGFFEPSGMIFNLFDEYLGLGPTIYKTVEMRNIYGVIFILSFALYPYVYLLTLSSFSEQSYCAAEVGKSMGLSPIQIFTKINIPLARPGIIAGLSFVAMETLSEFGAMDYYGVSTFTTGIYRTWFAFGDDTSALHLASILLSFVFIVLILENLLRGKSQYTNPSKKFVESKKIFLKGKNAFLASLWCLVICLLGFLVPFIQLIIWIFETYPDVDLQYYFNLIWSTIWLASISAFLILFLSLYICYMGRSFKDFLTKIAIKIFTLGYSIPGIIIAMGVMTALIVFDRFQSSLFDGSPLFYLTGSFVGLVFAYIVRFSTISIKTNESGLDKIKLNIDNTAKSFGLSGFSIIKGIHFPIMKTSIISALILVFVDIAKELPATLVLRPFNFETLATHIYELASAESLSMIASPALALIFIGLIPVMILSKKIVHNEYATQTKD